jgi:hypothetical protein
LLVYLYQMLKYALFTFILLQVDFTCISQEKKTLSGYITNEKTGENLYGVTVYDTVSKQGTTSNEYGFYSLTIPKKDAFVRVSYFGLVTQYVFVPKDRTEFNFQLSEFQDIEEVVVSSEGTKRSVESTNTGTMELSLDKVEKLPVLLGEKDVFKILQLLPGVKTGGEGSSGLYVRGGGPDQNLILLDGVPVYNASHLFGFFSVFNSDALSSVTMIKGGFPARYGGRISSVLDMRMKEGNLKHYNVEGSVGIISSRILVEGPLIKNKTAFAFSARRTYLDALVRPFMKEDVGGYYFYDLNAKIHHKINEKHHLYLSGYFGLDKAFIKSRENNFYNEDGDEITRNNESKLAWGNTIGALRWNYRVRPKLFVNTTLTYSKYNFQIGFKDEEITSYAGSGIGFEESFEFGYLSGIEDFSLKSDFTFIPSPNHNMKFGVGNIYHIFSPGVNYAKVSGLSIDQNQDTTYGSRLQFSNEMSFYFEDDFTINTRLKVNFGVHNTLFFTEGRNYFKPQPRLNANYMLTENSSFKLGLSRTAQFLHLLSNTGIGLPTDLWVPATSIIKPITANQISIGYNQEIKREYNFVVEAYYKKMNNLIQYKEGVGFIELSDEWQDRVEVGQGWSYGIEFFVEKRKGKFSGWIGYTLSWAERQFDNLNEGRKFYYRYDRRNDVSVALTYDINKSWDFGLVFVFGTGNAVTLGSQNYSIAPQISNLIYANNINYFSQLNDYRMPAYHRMDVGFNRKKEKKWGETITSFSAYNVYNRMNAFFIYEGVNKNGNPALMQISLFPIIPSISWKFKFDFKKIELAKKQK